MGSNLSPSKENAMHLDLLSEEGRPEDHQNTHSPIKNDIEKQLIVAVPPIKTSDKKSTGYTPSEELPPDIEIDLTLNDEEVKEKEKSSNEEQELLYDLTNQSPLEKQLENLKKDCCKLNEKNVTLKREIQTANKCLEAKTHEVTILRKKKNVDNVETKSLKDELDACKCANDILVEELENKEAEIRKLKSINTQQKKEVKALLINTEELLKQKLKLEDAFAGLKQTGKSEDTFAGQKTKESNTACHEISSSDDEIELEAWVTNNKRSIAEKKKLKKRRKKMQQEDK